MALYENSVKHFMDYFNKVEKMVTVDVSCGIPDVIWCKICDFFTEFNFQASKTPETVIIFGLGKISINSKCNSLNTTSAGIVC